MRGRALVIGGGGATGNAWALGVVAGLFDAHLDVTKANLIIGTSAGATAAVQLRSELKPIDLLANILAESARPRPDAGALGGLSRASASVDAMELSGRIIRASESLQDMRVRLGAAASEMHAESGGAAQAQWRATVSARLPIHHWPDRALSIVAVDADTGEPVVFDRHSGVELVDAVAASCANGFGLPPYELAGKRYIDGGYRANENADLAAAYSRVLVLSPLGGRSRHALEWGTHLSSQMEILRAGGSRVEAIFPDSGDNGAVGFGMNMTNLSKRPAAAQEGYNQGIALAAQLADFWR
nr:patatin-like phospholipase family protein [Ramlibacter ginsenosidimutans]